MSNMNLNTSKGFLPTWKHLGHSLVALSLAVWGLAFIGGCQPSSPTPQATTESHDGHDHAGHDHAGHDHAGHDHAGHDHAGHDHAGHDHDGHDHDAAGIDVDSLPSIAPAPTYESMGDAVAELVKVKMSVAKGFEEDNVDSVHDELHGVGNLLECISGMVGKSDLDEKKKAEASAAVESLFDSYGDVDEKLHGGEGKAYADVAKDIDAAIETLSNLAK